MEARQSLVPGRHLGCSGFSSKPTMRPAPSTSSTPYCPRRQGGGHPDDRHRELGLPVLVELAQQAVVHLVDVVAGQDQHLSAAMLSMKCQVLADGVGGLKRARAV